MAKYRAVVNAIAMVAAAGVCVSPLRSQPAPASGALRPFWLEQQIRYFGPGDLQPRGETTRVFAQRADGSHMTSFTHLSPNGEPGVSIEIFDRPRLLYITTEPFTKSVMTHRRSLDQLRSSAEMLRNCEPHLEQLRSPAAIRGELLGFAVVETRISSPHDTVVSWIAPDLDCYALRQVETFKRGSRNEKEVTRIELGEPPASLFTVPEGFVERSPAAAEALYSALFPGHSLWGSLLPRLEQSYRAGR